MDSSHTIHNCSVTKEFKPGSVVWRVFKFMKLPVTAGFTKSLDFVKKEP